MKHAAHGRPKINSSHPYAFKFSIRLIKLFYSLLWKTLSWMRTSNFPLCYGYFCGTTLQMYVCAKKGGTKFLISFHFNEKIALGSNTMDNKSDESASGVGQLNPFVIQRNFFQTSQISQSSQVSSKEMTFAPKSLTLYQSIVWIIKSQIWMCVTFISIIVHWA